MLTDNRIKILVHMYLSIIFIFLMIISVIFFKNIFIVLVFFSFSIECLLLSFFGMIFESKVKNKRRKSTFSNIMGTILNLIAWGIIPALSLTAIIYLLLGFR